MFVLGPLYDGVRGDTICGFGFGQIFGSREVPWIFLALGAPSQQLQKRRRQAAKPLLDFSSSLDDDESVLGR